jgi:hypothetical protein
MDAPAVDLPTPSTPIIMIRGARGACFFVIFSSKDIFYFSVCVGFFAISIICINGSSILVREKRFHFCPAT